MLVRPEELPDQGSSLSQAKYKCHLTVTDHGPLLNTSAAEATGRTASHQHVFAQKASK